MTGRPDIGETVKQVLNTVLAKHDGSQPDTAVLVTYRDLMMLTRTLVLLNETLEDLIKTASKVDLHLEERINEIEEKLKEN